MDKCQKMISTINYHTYVTESFEISTPIYLTYISNSLNLINLPIIPYNACISYINITLKKYLYLFLYNSNRYNDTYEFKNSDLCLGYKKEHNKEKVVD